ncbi:MAG: two pore domain potassium channel family protein [Anaerolineales bacterium]|nr:MAG: two pore domain potassium channel family protein [Anaerolineales bacterium]
MTEIRSENYLRSAQRQLAGGFLPLLALLVLLFILAFLIDEWTEGRVALSLLFFTVMVTAVKLSVRRRRIVLLVLAAAALSWAAVVADDIFDVLEIGAAGRIVVLALLAFAIVTVLGRVVADERVTLNTVYGAVCVYFLLVLFWALIFILIEHVESGSFSGIGGAGEEVSDFLYLSMVTQTTLGYGDITPVSGLPRSLAALEAFFGQVFLVGTVARLVALQVAHSGRAEVGEGDPLIDQPRAPSVHRAPQGDPD